MSQLRILTVCALLPLAAGAALNAQQTPDSLRTAFTVEARLLDEAIDEYGRSRSRERSAVDDLQRLSRQLDDALEDPNVSLAYLTGLEAELAVASDRACARAEETARARRRIYERMERLAGVAREFERQSELLGGAQPSLDGMWQIEAQPIDVYGLLNLRMTGSQVSGPYRLSNGRKGSMRGSLAGNRLELQVIDSERGVVATIEATVDAGGDEIRGTWLAMELTSGLPATGDWTAERVSTEEEIDLGS